MNRKEAIDILNNERIVIWTEPDEEEIARKQNEAIDMAIEALEVLESPTGYMAMYAEDRERSDLISRQALCQYALNQKDKSVTPNDIMRFPSADRPSGKWKPSCADIPKNCSVCGEDWDEYVYGAEMWYTGELPKFCPNCGADMRGDTE